ncbi:MAG: hypothetical protein Q9210_004112, partial [Variospora velana]
MEAKDEAAAQKEKPRAVRAVRGVRKQQKGRTASRSPSGFDYRRVTPKLAAENTSIPGSPCPETNVPHTPIDQETPSRKKKQNRRKNISA